jgi:Baseplate J-like protein
MENIIGYENRSAEQIFNAVLALAQTELPEITDPNDLILRSFWIWANISETQHYYINHIARESNAQTAELYKSLVRQARNFDYRIRGNTPAFAVITFTLTNTQVTNVFIPKGTVVQTEQDITFTTIQDCTIIANTLSIDCPAEQIEVITSQNIGTTSGLIGQKLLMPENTTDSSVTLVIGADTYTPQDSFYRSLPDDTHFIQTISETTETELILGDGVNGKLPASNQSVLATYSLTLGKSGRIGKGAITRLISTITALSEITVTNENDSVGGNDFEDIGVLRRKLPQFIRTSETATTKETYIALAETAQNVAKAGINHIEGDTLVEIYIVPIGGGVASQSFLDQVRAYMLPKILICTQLVLKSAGQVDVLLDFEVYLLPNAPRIATEQLIKSNLVTYGSLETQEINGEITSGKLNQIVCNTLGVESCVMNEFNIRPFARAVNNTQLMNWQVSMQTGSTNINVWKIVFTTPSKFNLFKNDNYEGNFDVNIQVIKPEVVFTILQNYSIANQFTFTTYPYLGNRSGKYILQEPSILRISEGDINLNIIGGI